MAYSAFPSIRSASDVSPVAGHPVAKVEALALFNAVFARAVTPMRSGPQRQSAKGVRQALYAAALLGEISTAPPDQLIPALL